MTAVPHSDASRRGEVLAAVFARYPDGGGERLLALALAHAVSEDGTLTVRASVSELARMTQQTPRAVQKQLRRMEASGWLRVIEADAGTRCLCTVYRISGEWMKGEVQAVTAQGRPFDPDEGAEAEPSQAPANPARVNLIQRAWRVRADAPPWRNDAGESFEFCVCEWMRCQQGLQRLPTLSEFGQVAARGDYCGVAMSMPNGQGEPGFYLTRSALTACVAELGIECATPAALHHVVFDLVELGLMRRQVDEVALPGLAKQPMYWISEVIFDAAP